MTARVFVDANVFLYANDPAEPVKQQRAQAWLERLWHERAGRTSLQVLSEFHVNLRRLGGERLAPQDAWARVAMYLAWTPQPIDETLFRRAREIETRWKISWWDSMVVGAAQLQDCETLLTEDLQDGMVFGTVTVRNPFAPGMHQAAAAYAPRPQAASPHRARGRPKRKSLSTETV